MSPTASSLPAQLVLEDGRVFIGRSFGTVPVRNAGIGEVVFNTSMTGYQEIITDPSYADQIVVMTYPMIGNTGINERDFEARRAYLGGLVVKELSRIASTWRHDRSLSDYLTAQGVPGLCGVDTRALVRHLRDHGAMRGVIAAASVDPAVLVGQARAYPPMLGQDLASAVSHGEVYPWHEPSLRLDEAEESTHARESLAVVVYDFGVKRNIVRRLVDVGCKVTVVPADTSAEDVLARHPDGVLLSNGPGDPDPVTYAIDNIRALRGRVPLFGICLGHQLLALASGASTYKLPFGHRGGNHPVMDLATGRVAITSHNHGFSVDADSLPDDVEITHTNLNDQTLEGLRLRSAPAFSVQYHPEAAPGPHDASPLFERFVHMMADWRGKR